MTVKMKLHNLDTNTRLCNQLYVKIILCRQFNVDVCRQVDRKLGHINKYLFIRKC